VDEANPVPPDRAQWTVTITDKATGQPLLLVLKPPKDSESSSRKGGGALIGKTLEDVIGVHTGGPKGRRLNDVGHSEDIYRLFAEFIRTMLVYPPAQRASAKEALAHAYLLANIDFPAVQSHQGGASATSSSSGDTTSTAAATTAATSGATAGAGGAQQTRQEESKDASSSSTAVLPRRRCRSAPRLTSTAESSSLLSSSQLSQERGQGGGGMADESGHAAKKLTVSDSSTLEQQGQGQGQSEKDNEEEEEKEEEGEAMPLDQAQTLAQGVEGSVNSTAPSSSSSSSSSKDRLQPDEEGDEGPMETSEVDDEGHVVGPPVGVSVAAAACTSSSQQL
jgi:serine/threonine protein kinase